MVSDRNHIRCTNHSLEGMESIGFKPTLLPPPVLNSAPIEVFCGILKVQSARTVFGLLQFRFHHGVRLVPHLSLICDRMFKGWKVLHF